MIVSRNNQLIDEETKNETVETFKSTNEPSVPCELIPEKPSYLSDSFKPLTTEQVIETQTPIQALHETEIKSDEVVYLKPDAQSFDHLKASDWMLPPTAEENFIAWAANNPQPWIRQPNADTDDQLLNVVNLRARESGLGRDVKVGLNAFGTGLATLGIMPYINTHNIKPGEIHFSTNAGIPEIHMGAGLHYLSGLRHAWGNIRNARENYIKEDNITIARILPGTVGIAIENGNPIVLLPGRHGYNSALFNLEEKAVHDVNVRNIASKPLSIVRIKQNELGLAHKNGNPIILLPGTHVNHDANFAFAGVLDSRTLNIIPTQSVANAPAPVPQEFYEFGNISIIRIPKGKIGCAMQDNEPVLLLPGIHIKNSQAFKYEKSWPANEPHIQFNTVHVIQVQSNQIGLAWDANKPIILNPGIYQVSSPTFKFIEFKNVNEPLIQHGTRTIVRVNQGQLGYAWHHGKVVELPPGVHEFDDPQFIYGKSFPANQPVIQFGNITHIIVNAGEKRAVWDDGKLHILEPGRHTFKSTTLKISEKPISLQDIIKPLHEIKVTTKDRMPMHVTGQVTYRVKSPEQLITGIGQDKLDDAIEKCTDAILRHQISLTDLSMISPDHHHTQPEEKGEHSGMPVGDSPLFGDRSSIEGDNYRGKLCTLVQTKLTDDTKKWGIEIVEFAISDIGFQDKDVEKNLADATAKTRQAEAQFDLQRAQNATTLAKVKADAAQAQISQRNNADNLKIETEAKAAALIAKTESEANAALLKSKKEADAALYSATKKAESAAAARKIDSDTLVYQAQAERDAAILRAEGQKALADAQLVLLRDPNYLRLEEMKLQCEISKNLARMPTPAVVFNGDSSAQQAGEMFFANGPKLIDIAMKTKGALFKLPVPDETSAELEEKIVEEDRLTPVKQA
ncbi:MAG: SPFH domain-containing protein [Gammaproteobacteria bacterium]|nr:SPFH domain-containing protein [Gammaproteobacteria bacterium]